MIMNEDRIFLSSQAIDLSETNTYIELTNRLCYYGEPNLNGVLLPIDGALDKATTLVNMPVVAKYKRVNGQDDLGGHEVYVDPSTNDIKFGTENIGTHLSVEIKDDDVEIHGSTKTLPCLFATSRIWARNKNVISAIKRLFSEGNLTSSWEILTSSFTFENGVKTLTDYVFEANALLGSTVIPAYSCAKALSVASLEESQLLIAEALANDITISEKEEVNMDKIEDNAKVETNSDEADTENMKETSEINSDTEKKDIASLTDWDLRQKLNEVCRSATNNNWVWVSFVFPAENYCLCEYDGRESELDYLRFDYAINGDVVTIGDPIPSKLVVTVSQINSAIAQRDEALNKANETIQTLKAEVEITKPFKEAAEKAEKERVEAEKKTKIDTLAQYAKKSGFISETEISEDGDIKTMISELNEEGIKSVIATRFMDSLNDNTETAQIETASVETENVEEVSTNLNDDDVGVASIVKIFLNK